METSRPLLPNQLPDQPRMQIASRHWLKKPSVEIDTALPAAA